MSELEQESLSDTWLKNHAGWGQLVLSIIAYAVMVGWVSKGWSDQAEMLKLTSAETDKQMSSLAASLTTLSDHVTQLALTNERMLEHMSNGDQRMDRLEHILDSTYGNSKKPEDWKRQK